jgi:signal transduction histidine kinase
MPEEERDKVTGRFYSVDAIRQRRGSGLGLNLVQAIADYHNTELTLSDNAPGLRVAVAFNR